MEWKTINEFPTYQINKIGQIKNVNTGKILSQSLSSKGYYQVNVSNTTRRVHKLLAECFINNPNNLETVNHIDGDKLNNSLSNLEWMSRSNNVKHSREVLGIIPIPYSKSNKIHHLNGKIGDNSNAGKKIISIDSNGIETIYGSAYEAALKLFDNKELGKQIRQSIKRNSSNYRGIKFKEYASTDTT